MDKSNPYASPTESAPPVRVVQQNQTGGVWRQGKLLVMHKHAQLPPYCVKSNQPVETHLPKKLQWHHPAIAFTILAGLIVYVILAVILTKRANIQLPLTQEWRSRRVKRITIAWIISLAGVACFPMGIVLMESSPDSVAPLMFLLGLFLFIGGLIYAIVTVRLVALTRITDTHVWLKGVHPDYLARLLSMPSDARQETFLLSCA